MNATIKSILSIFIPTIFGALCIPALAAAAPPSGRVAIVNGNSGLCLTIAGGSRDNNAEVVQYTCDDHPSRFWRFTVVNATDIVEITNLNSGLCLTVAGGGTDKNTTAVQYPCDGHRSRRWRYTRVDERTFQLMNVNSGLCLTVAGGGTDKNTTAVQYPCDGHRSRDWRFRVEPVLAGEDVTINSTLGAALLERRSSILCGLLERAVLDTRGVIAPEFLGFMEVPIGITIAAGMQ